jgi:hypothetical protein
MTDKVREGEMHVAQEASRRDALRAELEATRAAFHGLVRSFDGPPWQQKSITTDWTFGEVLVHLTWALEQLPQEIDSARRNKGMFNFPRWLAWLVNPLSYWYGRSLARGARPDDICRRYDGAMDATLIKLDTIQDDEWSQGADFYGEGFHSIEDLFHTPAKHFADHTAGWPMR